MRLGKRPDVSQRFPAGGPLGRGRVARSSPPAGDGEPDLVKTDRRTRPTGKCRRALLTAAIAAGLEPERIVARIPRRPQPVPRRGYLPCRPTSNVPIASRATALP